MKIHEYQAKAFFAEYGIPINEGYVCADVDAALEAYHKLNSPLVVVKAQVLTGGRGKAGGVKLARNEKELRELTESILGMTIKGYKVDRVMVARAVDIASEHYVSYVVDRTSKTVILMMSNAGGVDIEEVAHKTPEKIHKIAIDPAIGVPDYFARKAAFILFKDLEKVNQAARILQKLYKLFIDTDASLTEINPLVLTDEGKVVAIDAKMTFDDNALYRHQDIAALFEPTEEEQKEKTAKAKGFSYVKLDGNIGCMVNGAGLAMATMDLIKLYGGDPANFLDIGGSSNPTKVVEAMKLLLADRNVKVVLINIFGGITRCNDVATGLLEAFESLKENVPIVIRLAGTNEKEGREILQGKQFYVANTMSEATKMAVELVGKIK